MPVSIRRVGNEPIIIATFTDPFDYTDVEKANDATAKLIAERNGLAYRIEDISTLSLDFSTVVEGIGSAAHPRVVGTVRDPNARFVYVGQGAYVDMVVNSLAQEQYGGVTCPVFATVDEALAYTRTIP